MQLSFRRGDRKVAQEVDPPISIQIRIFDRQCEGLRRPCHVGQAQNPQVVTLRFVGGPQKTEGLIKKIRCRPVRVKALHSMRFSMAVEATRDLVGSSGRSGWVAHGSDVRFVERL